MSFFVNRVYAVTGATSGIGQAVAVELAKNGAKILALGRNEEKLKNLLNNLEGKNHSYRLFDSNKLETCEEAIKSGVEEMGKLSGFVHSAGVTLSALLRDLDIKDAADLMQINLTSFFFFSKACLKMGRYEKGTMSIVGLSSYAAFDTKPALSLYAASKAGLIAGCKSLASEYSKKGVRFNCIAPSYVDTNMIWDDKNNFLGENELSDKIKNVQPLGIIKPNEVCNLILFLLSDLSSKITAECIKISAGYDK